MVGVATFSPGRRCSAGVDVLSGWSSGGRGKEAWPGLASLSSNSGMWGVHPRDRSGRYTYTWDV